MGDHYIPQYYLRGFTEATKRDCIWAFRDGEEPFQTSIRKIAQEGNFYSRELERFLADEVESPANMVISKVQKQQKISQSEKMTLAKYMTVMYKRVPKTKELMKKNAHQIINTKLEALSRELNEESRLHPENSDKIENKRKVLQGFSNDKAEELAHDSWLQLVFPETTPNISLALGQMTWRFMIARRGLYYITCDNPLFYFPSLGIGKNYSEVSFPITKEIALWATWRSNKEEGFFPAKYEIVKQLNSRTVYNSTHFLYSPSSEKWIKRLANIPKEEIELVLIP